MEVIDCDAKGRIYLRRALRERYGKIFVAVPARRELVLIPVSKDALEDMRELGKPLQGKTLSQLKALIAEEATRQAVGE